MVWILILDESHGSLPATHEVDITFLFEDVAADNEPWISCSDQIFLRGLPCTVAGSECGGELCQALLSRGFGTVIVSCRA